MRFPILAAACLAIASLGGCKDSAGEGATAEQAASLVPVTIRTAKGDHVFRVEMARTEAEQEQGLMYRSALPADGGMLFPTPEAQPRSFWMKNTLIPLDMIFIRADGSIARIAEETVPQSLDPVASGEPVIAVLEIAGGRSAALGITEGDQVSWPDGPARK